MLRPALFAAAVCAILPTARAADPKLSGNWIVYHALPTGDVPACVLKIRAGGPKASATVVMEGAANTKYTVTDMIVTDTEVSFSLKQVQSVNGQKFTGQFQFHGTIGKDDKVVLGSFGFAERPGRGKMVPTDTPDAAPPHTKHPATDDYIKANIASKKADGVRAKLERAKDADKKAELREQLAAARAETAAAADIYREIIAKHPDSVLAATCAVVLLGSADAMLTPDEAEKLLDVIRKDCAAYGPRFAGPHMITVAHTLAPRTDIGAVGLKLIEPMVKDMKPDTRTSQQVSLLTAYKTVLTNAGRLDEAKAVEDRLAKLKP